MATIQIADNDARVQYTQAITANSTQLTIDFPFFALDDIKVVVTNASGVDTTLSRGTGTGTFAVTGTAVDDGFSGGHITLGDSYANTTKTTIFRDIPITRTTDFPTSGPFNVASLNTELDKLTAVAQQNETSFSRTLQLSDSDETVDLKLPNKDTRKSKTLAFNATTGVPEAGPSISDVQTVSAASADIATLADIEDGTDATDAIQTVAGIANNVTTVAGISGNVTSVAGNATNINAVVSNASNINTVAGKESEITSVAAKASLLTSDFVSDLNTLAVTDVINDINTLATSDIVSDLNTLATSDIVSDLNTLATSDIVSDINTLATSDIVTDLNLLATSDFVSDLNTIATTTNVNNLATVAGAVSNVNTVAGISSDVTAVAGISSDVAAVEDIAANVTSVAGNASNINAAVSNASNINAVVSNASNINSVAGIAANVTTVAGIASNVTTVAGAASNVSTVAGAITNVNNVGGSIANVNTVATNISGVNNFAERYRVGSSDPSSSLDAGDLAYNTSDNALKYYTGSAWASITAGIGNVVEDVSPQLGGALDVNGNSITSASNGDITIDPNGTGDIVLDANVQIGTTTEGIADYGDTLTLADSDHCGMTIRSGTSSEGNVYFSDGTSGDAEYKGIVKYDHGSNAMSFWSNSLRRMDITSGGNVGIGTASPTAKLEINGGTDNNIVRIVSTDVNANIEFADNTTTSGLQIGAAGDNMKFGINGTEVARLDSNGNLGLGTVSPNEKLTIDSGALSFLGSLSTPSIGAGIFRPANNTLAFVTGSSERARFNSAGALLIGKTSDSISNDGISLAGSATGGGHLSATNSGNPAFAVNRKSSDGSCVSFNRDGSIVGSVSVTSSGTTYNTTSDIRLKTDIEPIDHATDMLMAMNPVSHRWKADPDADAVVGFIAQEMQEIVPEAVSTGDDEDAMMSMDYGRITPILVSALQDAHRKIEQLEQRIADMEAN